MTVGPSIDTAPPVGLRAKLLVDARGVGELLSLSRASIFAIHSAGKLPRPVRPTGSDPRWRVSELAEWVRCGCPGREQWETMSRGCTP
jgi:predicted DNA-binding transcriptional regulator AlpA